MKSIKRIAVATLTLCAVTAAGISAQAAPADSGHAMRHRPGMTSDHRDGGRHMWKQEKADGVREGGRRFRQEKRVIVKEVRKSPALNVNVVVGPGRHGAPGYAGHKPGMRYGHRMHKSGFMAKLNLTPAQMARIKSIRSAARVQIAAVRNNPHLTLEAKKVRITSIRLSTRNRIRSILTLDQKLQFDAHSRHGRG